MQSVKRTKEIYNVSVVSVIKNGVLSVIKLITGFFGHSQALISDGVDSFADVFITGIVILGVNIGEKNIDDNHQYGHEKIESIASIFLSSVLLAAAIGIGIRGIKSINHILMGGAYTTPRPIGLLVAIVSIASKEYLFRYSKKVAKKTNSSVLLANAWNYRSDAIASVGSLIGIGGAMLGFGVIDPVASILIAALIVRVSIKIGKIAINEVTDHAADIDTQKKIYDIISDTDGVLQIDKLRTRLHGSRLFVDVDIAVDAYITVEKAHEIADMVSDRVCSHELGIKYCMVHVNPHNK